MKISVLHNTSLRMHLGNWGWWCASVQCFYHSLYLSSFVIGKLSCAPVNETKNIRYVLFIIDKLGKECM